MFLALIETLFGQALRLIDLYVKEPKKFGLQPKGQESSEDFFLSSNTAKKQWNFFQITALASKSGLIQKLKHFGLLIRVLSAFIFLIQPLFSFLIFLDPRKDLLRFPDFRKNQVIGCKHLILEANSDFKNVFCVNIEIVQVWFDHCAKVPPSSCVIGFKI